MCCDVHAVKGYCCCDIAENRPDALLPPPQVDPLDAFMAEIGSMDAKAQKDEAAGGGGGGKPPKRAGQRVEEEDTAADFMKVRPAAPP